MNDTQIVALESAAQSYLPDVDVVSAIRQMERDCHSYRLMLRQDPDAWKINLANLERISSSGYARVLATIPQAKQTELIQFVTANLGQPLPAIKNTGSVSAVKGISKIT